MTSLKVKFHPSTVAAKEGTLYYQVIHNRMVRQISTGYRLFAHEWNGGNIVLPNATDQTNRSRYLNEVVAAYERILPGCSPLSNVWNGKVRYSHQSR